MKGERRWMWDSKLEIGAAEDVWTCGWGMDWVRYGWIAGFWYFC